MRRFVEYQKTNQVKVLPDPLVSLFKSDSLLSLLGVDMGQA